MVLFHLCSVTPIVPIGMLSLFALSIGIVVFEVFHNVPATHRLEEIIAYAMHIRSEIFGEERHAMSDEKRGK